MDSLSTLVTSMGLRGRLDLLCRFAGAWSVPQPEAPPGQVPYHVVLAGAGVLEVGRERRPFVAGDLVLFPRGAAHTMRHADGATLTFAEVRRPLGRLVEVASEAPRSDFDVLCGTFELGQHHALLLRALPDVVHLHTQGRDDYAGLQALMRSMRHESLQASPGGDAVIAHLSAALFILVVRTLMDQGDLQQGLLALLMDARVAPALAAVIATPAEPWTLERLAGVSRMSRASFARHFAELSPATPMDVVTALRMDLAARLLRETPRSIESIGEACGYTARAAFGQAFKRVHGTSPAAFRRQAGEAATATNLPPFS
ncbi:cupin domain-containing protein [Frateuria terrea]|uniref:AraC family transcriptional regulator, activator of mtrCDE n=1 Tax=Frateuria terrea TaxID=529704 RepID=A0A1H6ZDT7_9GAMM|nr:AraC family transcriptional regulator [Frateuria terrea]SEJ51713.1 AraC family transcriptional regulator, activator of mtrCDE [Frateuria terrea]SFP79636.1 AraC family transcriptional regulator, activator of mtrCDE [Frateuria terrea]